MSANTGLEPVVEFLLGTKMAPNEMPWNLLRLEDIQVVRAWAAETQPLASQRQLLRALQFAIRSAPRVDDAATSVVEMRLRGKRPGQPSSLLTTREARLLLEGCTPAATAADARDGAILALMLLAGLRRVELVRLQRSDYDDEDSRLHVRCRASATRVVIVEGPCREHLQRWLAQRGGSPGPLFLAVTATHQVRDAGLSASAINRILAQRAHLAGVHNVTPRDLRGRFLRLLRSGQHGAVSMPCRYYLTEDGQPAWALPALQSA